MSSIFKDGAGEWSSKRTVGLAYAALGIVMVIGGAVLDKYDTDIDILLVVVGTALTSLGISNFSKPKKEDIQPKK